MKKLLRTIAIALAALLLLPAAHQGYQRAFNIWWQPAEEIEAFLRAKTPLGTSEAAVVDWLQAGGHQAIIDRNPVSPNDSYHPTTTGGAATIHTVLETHHVLFVLRDWVVAFYTFDTSGTLRDIRVRVDHDGP